MIVALYVKAYQKNIKLCNKLNKLTKANAFKSSRKQHFFTKTIFFFIYSPKCSTKSKPRMPRNDIRGKQNVCCIILEANCKVEIEISFTRSIFASEYV